MKNIILVFLYFPFSGFGQNLLGSELYINLKAYRFKNDTFLCQIFEKETLYKSIAKPAALTEKIERESIKMCSINKALDTIWFSNAMEYFLLPVFNKNDRILILINNVLFELPKFLSQRISTYSDINLHINSNYPKNSKSLTILSFIQLGDVIKPKTNFIGNKKKYKLIKQCGEIKYKKVKTFFELKNNFTGSN